MSEEKEDKPSETVDKKSEIKKKVKETVKDEVKDRATEKAKEEAKEKMESEDIMGKIKGFFGKIFKR